MEKSSILVVGAATRKGKLISKFLVDRGYFVTGTDRFNDDKSQCDRFFRIDTRFVDNIKLVLSLAKPEVVIFCPDENEKTEQGYTVCKAILQAMVDVGLQKLIVCLSSLVTIPKLTTIREVSDLSISHLVDVFDKQYMLDISYLVDTENLLKEIKKILKEFFQANPNLVRIHVETILRNEKIIKLLEDAR